MTESPRKAERPAHVEPDPRTDGVGDGGKRELEPLSDEEIQAGVEQERARQVADDDSEWPDESGELTRMPMRQVSEDEEARDNW